MEQWYDVEEDVVNIKLHNGSYWKSVELSNGMVIDIDKSGKMLSIEIPQARKAFSGDARKVIELMKH